MIGIIFMFLFAGMLLLFWGYQLMSNSYDEAGRVAAATVGIFLLISTFIRERHQKSPKKLRRGNSHIRRA